ncbi:MAG TPA: PAS domain-containing protein, partial [Candidatus Omnitrophota bacterium]|nr:PAS domain-containing protein [Candidatus Omnitrophota bacterium]
MDTGRNEARRGPPDALEVFEERDRAFRVLYDTVKELDTHKKIPPYLVLARNLKKICRAELVAIVRMQDVPSEVSLEAVVSDSRGEEGRLSPDGLTLPLPGPLLDLFIKSSIENIVNPEECLSSDFLEAVFAGRSVREELSFFAFSCRSQERLIAAGIIAVDKACKINARDILEIYLNFAGMVLERFHSAETMKDSERTLALILDSIPMGIMMIDRDKKCVGTASTGARELIGCQGRDIAGVPCRELFCLSPGAACPMTDR